MKKKYVKPCLMSLGFLRLVTKFSFGDGDRDL
jgi:hypothetical protein